MHSVASRKRKNANKKRSWECLDKANDDSMNVDTYHKPLTAESSDNADDDSSEEEEEYTEKLRMNGKDVLGYNVDFVTRVHLVYFRNERKNLQCFPFCQHFNEYSIGKLAKVKHPSLKGGSNCPGTVTVELSKYMHQPVLPQNILLLGRIAECESPLVVDVDKYIGNTIDMDNLYSMEKAGNFQRGVRRLEQEYGRVVFDFTPKDGKWMYPHALPLTSKAKYQKFAFEVLAFVHVRALDFNDETGGLDQTADSDVRETQGNVNRGPLNYEPVNMNHEPHRLNRGLDFVNRGPENVDGGTDDLESGPDRVNCDSASVNHGSLNMNRGSTNVDDGPASMNCGPRNCSVSQNLLCMKHSDSSDRNQEPDNSSQIVGRSCGINSNSSGSLSSSSNISNISSVSSNSNNNNNNNSSIAINSGLTEPSTVTTINHAIATSSNIVVQAHTTDHASTTSNVDQTATNILNHFFHKSNEQAIDNNTLISRNISLGTAWSGHSQAANKINSNNKNSSNNNINISSSSNNNSSSNNGSCSSNNSNNNNNSNNSNSNNGSSSSNNSNNNNNPAQSVANINQLPNDIATSTNNHTDAIVSMDQLHTSNDIKQTPSLGNDIPTGTITYSTTTTLNQSTNSTNPASHIASTSNIGFAVPTRPFMSTNNTTEMFCTNKNTVPLFNNIGTFHSDINNVDLKKIDKFVLLSRSYSPKFNLASTKSLVRKIARDNRSVTSDGVGSATGGIRIGSSDIARRVDVGGVGKRKRRTTKTGKRLDNLGTGTSKSDNNIECKRVHKDTEKSKEKKIEEKKPKEDGEFGKVDLELKTAEECVAELLIMM